MWKLPVLKSESLVSNAVVSVRFSKNCVKKKKEMQILILENIHKEGKE